ncbi:hypothetical protein [Helicobacter sp. T3_23-1056]
MTITLENVDKPMLEAIQSVIKLNPRVTYTTHDFSLESDNPQKTPSVKEAIDETIIDFQKPQNYAVFERLKDK